MEINETNETIIYGACEDLFTKPPNSKLECIKMTGKIMEILPETLVKFLALKTLFLPGNKIEIVTILPKSLESLSLNDNNISEIDQKIFPSTLESLNLSNNKLKDLDISNTNIKHINVSSNMLTYIKLGKKVKSLIIENNPFCIIDFNGNTVIESINLHNCKLTHLQKIPSSVVNLIISNNQIKSLENLPLNIETLNCTSNNITEFKCIYRKLKMLYISANELQEFICEDGYNSLEAVYCCSNNIIIIDVKGPLKRLVCNDNPIEFISVNSLCTVEYDGNVSNNLKKKSCTFIEDDTMHIFI